MLRIENVPDPHTQIEASWDAYHENALELGAFSSVAADDLRVNHQASSHGEEVWVANDQGAPTASVIAYDTVYEQVTAQVPVHGIAAAELILHDTGLMLDRGQPEEHLKFRIDVWDMSVRPPVCTTHELPTIARLQNDKGDILDEKLIPDLDDTSYAPEEDTLRLPQPPELVTMHRKLEQYAEALAALLHATGSEVPEMLHD
jgi:hypothetical protein